MNLLNMWKRLRDQRSETLAVLVALTSLGVVSHLVPHSAGLSTVGAIGMMAAALLPRHLLPVPVLFTVVAFDLIHGTTKLQLWLLST